MIPKILISSSDNVERKIDEAIRLSRLNCSAVLIKLVGQDGECHSRKDQAYLFDADEWADIVNAIYDGGMDGDVNFPNDDRDIYPDDNFEFKKLKDVINSLYERSGSDWVSKVGVSCGSAHIEAILMPVINKWDEIEASVDLIEEGIIADIKDGSNVPLADCEGLDDDEKLFFNNFVSTFATTYELKFTPAAKKEYKNLKSLNPALQRKTKELLSLISCDPFGEPPFFKKLAGFRDTYERRTSRHDRIVYSVHKNDGVIKVLKVQNHL